MKLRLLQLNMNADNYLPAIQKFLDQNTFDILFFQEVAGKNTKTGNINTHIDCFEWLQTILGSNYRGELAISQRFASDPIHSYLGQATFFHKDMTLEATKILTLFDNPTPYPDKSSGFDDEGRTVLSLTLTKEEKEFTVINAHLAWAPTSIEQPHQREQNLKLVHYIAAIQKPFILSGDFNIQQDQPSILDLENYATDLPKHYVITNTLNPRTHRASHIFPQGVAVDYLFASPQWKIEDFKVLSDLDLSDHFGLRATVEI